MKTGSLDILVAFENLINKGGIMIRSFVKKQIVFTFISIFISTIAWGQATFSGGGSGTEDDPYIIMNNTDWDAFANSVTNGYDYHDKYIKLGDDIGTQDNPVRTMVGELKQPKDHVDWIGKLFAGNFDGDWHTLYVNIEKTDEKYYYCVAPFAWVDGGATISNLTVNGTVTSHFKHAGGIISCAEQRGSGYSTEINVKNCTSSVTINCNGQNDGGLIGWISGSRVKFENCIFDGIMAGSTNNCAGFVGLISRPDYASFVTYTNCTQAHWQIEHTSTTVFGTFHLPKGYDTDWGTAYFTHKFNNGEQQVNADDNQGTPAYCKSNPIPQGYNKILKHYVRVYTGNDKEFYVPAAIVSGINTTDIYTAPIIPAVTYYGKELVYGKDFTTSISKEGKTNNVIVSAMSDDYFGSETFTGINVQSISTWKELKDLLEDSSKTRHITLNNDFECPNAAGPLEVKGTVVMRMNGHTIDRNLFELPANYIPSDDIPGYSSMGYDNGYVMKVVENANLTIYGGGIIKGGCNLGDGSGILNYGTLTVEGVTIKENFSRRKNTNGPYGTGTGIYSSGTLNVDKCIITYNVGDGGGSGIYMFGKNTPGSTYTIKNSEISYNRANSKGGGIRICTNNAVVEDCKIKNNVVKNQGNVTTDVSDGGGIYVHESSNSKIKKCEITGNNSDWRGGGVFVNTNGGLTMENCKIKNNSSLGEQNVSGTGGGGVFLFGSGNLVLKDCDIEENSSYTVGGVYSEGSRLKIEGDIRIIGNIGDATKANVYLASNNGVIVIQGPLRSTAKIGVSKVTGNPLPTSLTVTQGLKNNGTEDNFISDNYMMYWLTTNSNKEVLLQKTLRYSEDHTTSNWTTMVYVQNGTQFINAPIIIDAKYKIDDPIKFGSKHSAIFIEAEKDGQLVYDQTTSVKVSVLKSIAKAAEDEKDDVYGWYTISSPVENVMLSGENPGVNLITSESAPYNFDLFRYNEKTAIWENYTVHDEFDRLENGRGYLYRNKHNLSIEYTGEIHTADVSYKVTNSPEAAGGALSGWNLIGNPYTFSIYKGGGSCAIVNDDLLTEGFYRLTKSGSWGATIGDGTAIKPGEGILVKALTTDELTIHRTDAAPSSKANSEYIEFTVSNNSYEDVAYALFKEEGEGLPKINHRNPDVQMLYINREGENYAIATMSDDVKTFGLNFSAKTTGQYTLSCDKVGDFSYLHVIDRLTGQDTDMLLEGKYSFIGSPKDSDARFIVRLSYNGGGSENEEFAYQSGNDVVVCGEGELQVYDALGRKVMTRRVNGVETINLGATGVYILRLTGAETMTQKMVVR